MTILEVTVSGILLVTMMSVCLEFFGAAAAQRRAARQRQTAIQEAANVMERLSVRPWDELSGEGAAAPELSPAARRVLPGGKLTVDVAGVPDEPAAKRITVSIQWEAPAGDPPRPVRLVAWRYRS